jgi:hypothetical protein
VGSIGAVDGTYGMRPNCNCAVTANVTAEVEEYQARDSMYSRYKSGTAYHYVLLTSHGIRDGKKIRFWVWKRFSRCLNLRIYVESFIKTTSTRSINMC